MTAHRVRAPFLLVTALLVVSGCSGPGPRAAEAGTTAVAFVRAVAQGDGDAACAVLTPRAAEGLADDAGTSCAEAVLAQDVVSEVAPDGEPSGGPEAKAFGRAAQVHLDGDVLFLSLSRDGWRISAAGCTPRPDQPYDCVIEGS